MVKNSFNLLKVASIIKSITLSAVLWVSYSVQANIISFDAGIDISGIATTRAIDGFLGDYEVDLLGTAFSTYGRNNQDAYSIKFERDFYNIETVTGRRGSIVVGGDFNTNVAARFTNENSRDLFAEIVSEKTSLNNNTEMLLAGSPFFKIFGLDLEEEKDQGRPSDPAFFDTLFDDEPYSLFSFDFSFDFTGSASSDYYGSINDELFSSLNSFYLNSEVSIDVIAVEHDIVFNADPNANYYYSGSIKRKMWFDNESDAKSAQAFFNTDIFEHYRNSSQYSFSNEKSIINQVTTEDPINVPEPSTIILFLLAMLLLIKRNLWKQN